MNIQIAPKIRFDSWLNSKEYQGFVKGYYFATTQTRAIPGLAKLTPEEVYFIVESVNHGIRRHEILEK